MATRMVRTCGGEPAVRKGPWTLEEDLILVSYISEHGEGSWDNLARAAGLNRNGKSCRLRWLNYLRPGVRRGSITAAEDAAIRELQAALGNKWSKIAKHLPGRTDNEIKNYWRTRIQKRAPATAQHQKLLRRQPTTAAISEGASSSSGTTSASQDSSGGATAGDCWFMTQPKIVAAAAPAAMVKSEGGGVSSAFAASQDSSATTAGDDWYTQQASYPYYPPSGLSSAAEHHPFHHLGTGGVDDTAATTAQFFASADQFSDSLWNAVNTFWETIPVKGAF